MLFALVFSKYDIWKARAIMANNLTRFSPFNDIVHFEPLRGFEDLLRDFRLAPSLRELEARPSMKMDVTETDQAYTVKAEIPGMKKEDIKIDIDGNQVSITAETKQESDQKDGETVIRSERYYGRLFRSFTLAHEIDEAKAIAKYHDGVLDLSLPKKARASAKQVTVS
jgi:HSP20 family protein